MKNTYIGVVAILTASMLPIVAWLSWELWLYQRTISPVIDKAFVFIVLLPTAVVFLLIVGAMYLTRNSTN